MSYTHAFSERNRIKGNIMSMYSNANDVIVKSEEQTEISSEEKKEDEEEKVEETKED